MGTAATYRKSQLQQLALNRLRRISVLEDTQLQEQRPLILRTVYSIYLDCKVLGISDDAKPLLSAIHGRLGDNEQEKLAAKPPKPTKPA